ncbi:tRNA pseudouridine(38-40) synthase TruA [Clostridium sardiniense]|uniref:tRNA pseudouridine synthase A n=1 Tax=Clostridium sardiniense TaxID=29369 RepID=A0ABS7KTU3_CLOSR|nr:tRNA pseudouridine(38-40) synthase TruA [Clostridium sardiniense]MBY0754240.1 tRNA pseudouridine(38-40) synthase TruA [Clostridium sardiniense]MDQ0461217.1 tRNA pseudouridine38-40 synthase [Clostridium sardiniense]
MRNLKLTLQYDGTRYKGFQKQNQKGSNVVTIQGKLENVLSKMTGEEIKIIGCGRTDSGVHAENYIANFTTNSVMTCEKMFKYLLEYLPEDIAIKSIKNVSERFHSRYNVKSKTYVYTIDNNTYRNVFLKKYAYYIDSELDIEKMKEAAKLLVGTHDFESFTSLKGKKKSTIRTINYIDISKKDGIIKVEVNGNSFMLNMVRILAGTLIEVGLDKIQVKDINEIIEAKDRARAGHRAPAHGLCLKELQY